MCNQPSTIRNLKSARPGLSLLEVLISIGIITIGLLGTLAMFPVGAHKIGKANQYDRSTAVGQGAFHDIITRRLLRPDADAWVQPNGGQQFVDGTGLGTTSPRGALRGEAFAIDPLWCSYVNDVDEGPHASLLRANFPVNPDAPQSYTTTAPGTQWPAPNIPGAPPLGRRTFAAAGGGGIPSALAEMAFQSRDDLIFELPDDRDLPAKQLFKTFPPGDPTASDYPAGLSVLHRQYTGDFSWMFTAVPKSSSFGEDLYTVSVVVFHKRRLDISPLKPPERMVQVDSNNNGTPGDIVGGYGGVEANLFVPAANRAYLEDIRAGEWVMLSASTANGPIFKWYRVTSTQDEIQDDGSGAFTRWVSLAGADLDPSTLGPVYVSLFEGAIAVFEKTMRVEGSSMYVVE